jgi:hypothetical protein
MLGKGVFDIKYNLRLGGGDNIPKPTLGTKLFGTLDSVTRGVSRSPIKKSAKGALGFGAVSMPSVEAAIGMPEAAAAAPMEGAVAMQKAKVSFGRPKIADMKMKSFEKQSTFGLINVKKKKPSKKKTKYNKEAMKKYMGVRWNVR